MSWRAVEMSPTCLSGLGPHDRLSLPPFLRPRWGVTKTSLACCWHPACQLAREPLPLTSSGASDVRLLPPLPPHSPPAQSCPALHLWEANWLRGTCGLCGSPQESSPSRRRAWHRASFYLPPLCTFASVNRPRPAPPPPGVVCVAERTGRGFKEVEEKALHQGSWDGSAEAVKILLHVRGERQRLQRRHRAN